MEYLDFGASPLALLAPTVAIALAVITRRVLWSLGAGILTGAVLLAGGSPLIALQRIADGFVSVFWVDGALNTSSIYILLFLIALGVLTSLISISGGAKAFGEWACIKVKNRQSAQVLVVFLGVLIFIDDYFNSLAVGNIGRPLTDRHRISRAKLSYLIDSTAAPICVMMPISSWGAYIITLIATIMASHGLVTDSPVYTFISMIPMNLYAVFALGMVICVATFNLNIGPMAKQEVAALNHGELFDHHKGTPPGAPELKEDKRGRVADLVSPIVVLIIATISAMIYTGAQTVAAEGEAFSILDAFENTNVTLSLILGGGIGLLFTMVRLLNRKISFSIWREAVEEGSKSMMPAIYILIFAWVLTGIIGDLETGKYLASLVGENISPSFLPMILFVVSGAMAFATGTSWGTFGIMLPIAGDMAAAADITMMMPMLASVLAGAVFGDHCSPISDTTILSSTGGSCHHIDHVNTQLPYALCAALICMLGYLVMGLTDSFGLGFLTAMVAFIATLFIFWRLSTGYAAKHL